jgi:hypothetical protein
VRAFVIVIALVFALPAHSDDLAGVGARPINDRVAATWFVRTADPGGTHEMAAVVFLLGRPGWTAEKTDWTFSPSWPAYSNFVFSDSSFRVELQEQPEVLDLLGERIPVAEANVIVVDRMHSPKARVVGKYKLNLAAPFSSDPVHEVLLQSEQLRARLGFE